MIQNNSSTSQFPSQDSILRLKQEMKLRRFSPKTVKSYLYYITSALNFANKSPRSICGDDLRAYLEKLSDDGRSASTLNTAYSALQFYFEKILRRRFFMDIPRAKTLKKIPEIFTKEEVKKILETIRNIKHKLMLGLMYSSGLRVSEVVNVRVRDLNFSDNLLYVRNAKGAKDRATITSEKVSAVLEKYTKNKNPDDYVFESDRGGKLTERSVQKIFTGALKNSGVKKCASCHSLRYSFATHLLEGGTDIRYIQELLGHAKLETTQIYTKVAKNNLQSIKSPLD